MNSRKPTTRTEADAPEATQHLSEGQKQALDTIADAEHVDPKEREHLTRKANAQADAPREEQAS